ncbi:MAG TPA: 2-hydroxyacyl-CoA dehydratase family protein [Myxococcales bacterium]|nr:2-hydroxyacyl-CoA dehydratase family protein [Myxococcales bacterium]
MAVLPVHYPKELLTAHGLLALELWGPPGPPRGTDAGRLQSYVCAVARNALAFLASGRAAVADAVLFPHTCDSLQGLATLAPDFGGWEKKTFVFQHPRGAGRSVARRFLEAELRSLSGELERWTGQPLTPERLAWAVRLHHDVDQARFALLDGRSRLPLTDLELYALLRRGEWLWPEEHLVELKEALAKLAPASAQGGVPLLVTGYVPEPSGLLAALGSAGLYIAADDYAAVGRRISRAPIGADPWAALIDRYCARPPCPTSASDQPDRMRYLEALFERSGARGVLVHVQKFCEPELFDVPAIRRAFAARGAPLLLLEGELEGELSGQAVTRIEAFAEMLRSKVKAA